MSQQVACFSIFSLLFMCTFGQIHYVIVEEVKQGYVVGNVVKDLGLNAKESTIRKLKIASHTKKHYFNINLENGNLYVIERIDREAICGMEEICLFNLEILAENPVYVFQVKIEIQDINDNYPSFSRDIFNISLSESTSPGTRIALGNARDPDIGINSIQTYSLTPNQHFKLGEKISADGIKYPELVLENSLDREKQKLYEFTLTATDGGKPVKTGTTIIRIMVQDLNDNNPVFSQDIYRVNLKEDVPIGFLVLRLSATDKDEGSNALVTYSFSHIYENPVNVFALDSQTGVITTKQKLDFETEKKYEITVEAKDGGGLASHCRILIQIEDVNDNAPEILLESLNSPIPEDSLPGILIALVYVNDLDSGKNSEVSCHINENILFKLNPSSNNYYKLTTVTSLDREMSPMYNITIIAQDEGSPPLITKKTIQLIVSDVNDNPPLFEKQHYLAYVLEHNLPGSSIHYVHASDVDTGENAQILYSILNTNIEDIPVSSYVSINSQTGIIYAQRAFDYEQLREFQFQVLAKDSGSQSLSSNVTVKICIIDKNDNAPKILYPSSDGAVLFEFIPHSSKKGFLVTKVIAVDEDSGHNAWLSYYFLEVPDGSFFIIDQQTGEIRIARDLKDTDSLRQKVVVLVKDNGIPSLSATVTLNMVVAENIQQVLPEIGEQRRDPDNSSNVTFYLAISITLISILFIFTVILTVICKYRSTSNSTALGTLPRAWYPQLSLTYPSDGSLPLPYSYDVCVTLDSKQNEIAYLKPLKNVPTDNLVDASDSATGNVSSIDNALLANLMQQAQPNTEWRFSQAQRPGPSGAQPTEEAGVWPNNQFETERLQAMILASANEAAEGTSGLGGGTGTMGLSARYGPQFTLQHVPDYRQNVYIPGSTLTPTNAAGKRDGKSGGNKKKSGKKEKK
ncbi:protocadherin gamma-B2-like isoform X40 [Spea bombifrons]|uniref:protocadherin gamma-B2-like isoform X40 n=1 Tax=Spea bombifrons TaxID=233779 RepID=UPI00234A9BDB|nr:protocadherin gamma-B2-like isoform X40 [Spea bombifrons]